MELLRCRRSAALAVGALLAGCGNEAAIQPDAGADASPPGIGPVGPVFDNCEESEVSSLGGGCERVGVPECWEGWATDGEDGCEPILPTSPCPHGTMEIIGEAECQPIGDCAVGSWGSVDIEAGAVFVDVSYVGASTGVETQPFRTIQEGVDAVLLTGGQIVVAAGDYMENVSIGSGVRIHGRCAQMVRIFGGLADTPSIDITDVTDVQVHDVTVSGPSWGVRASASAGVGLERLIVSDCGYRGIEFRDGASGGVRRSVLARNTHTGLIAVASTVDVEDLSVRDTLADAGGYRGRGIAAWDASTLTARRVVVTGNREVAMSFADSAGNLEEAVVRSTLPRQLDGQFGQGGGISGSSVVDIKRSLFAGNRGLGLQIYDGATANIEASIVADTLPHQSDDGYGNALYVVDEGTSATVTDSLLARNRNEAVHVDYGALVTLNGVVIRDTLPRDVDGKFGEGIVVFDAGSRLELFRSLLLRNRNAGLLVALGASAKLDGAAIRNTQAGLGELFGRGASFEHDVAVELRSVLVSSARDAGLFVGDHSHATLEDVVVRDVESVGDYWGKGIVFQDSSEGQLARVAIERTRQAGLSVIDSIVEAEDLVVRDTTADPTSRFGDGVCIFGLTDGVTTTGDLLRVLVEGSARAGVFFQNAGGSLVTSVVRDTAISVLLQGAANPTIAEDNVIEGQIATDEGLEPSPPLDSLPPR